MDHRIYARMSEPIRRTHAFLDDESTFTQEVDRVIEECAKSRLPCYLFVPMDTPGILVDAERLKQPLDLEVRNPSAQVEDTIVSKILSAFQTRQQPVLLADVLCVRHGGQDTVRALAELIQLPTFACPLSKGIIDEDKPYFNGVYAGKRKSWDLVAKMYTDVAVSFAGIQEAVEHSDLVLNVGPLLSDSNTGGYTRRIRDENLVLLAHDRCEVLGEKFERVHFLPVLKKLLQKLMESPQSSRPRGARLEVRNNGSLT